jgi:predicted acylesterase/phospholipase RssA/CRP-like cAMP-binding protein
VWAAAYAWYATQVGTRPAFLTEWLPGQVLSGVGVGATLPILGSAALAAVPGGRYAAASSVTSSMRQLGGVLGVALLVVIVGTPSSGTIAGRLRDGWWLSAATFVAVAAVALLLRREEATVVEGDGADLAPRVEAAAVPVPPRRRSAPSLIAELPPPVQEQLAAAGEPVTLPAGATLFERGDPSDALYLVQAGRLEAVLGGDVLRELHADEVVGELGVVAGSPRSATVRARRDTRLLRVDAARFQSVVAGEPETQRQLAAALARRLQESRSLDEEAPAPPRVVSVVAAGSSDAAAFAAVLCARLGEHLRVASPGRVTIDGLDRAERDHDRVVLVADRDDDPAWRDFCLRQADRLVVLADPSAPPVAGASYVVLTRAPASREELLAWWGPGVRRVVVAEPGEWGIAAARLAERLAGVSVGVALAGGGARAFAAVGVLYELERAGVGVDRIAGTSLGSIVAVLHASGLDAAAVETVCFEEFVRRNPFGDFTVPRVAIARGRRARLGLERRVGDMLFEELPREAAVVSTDLLARTAVTHRRGSVQEAVRGSFSLPGLFPPVRVGDSLHVDGGVLDNLPVAALEADEGPIVAVNISAGGSRRGRDGVPRVPMLFETLLRSMLMGSAAAVDEARRRATVVVTPDTRGIGLLEFHQLDRAVEAGRAAGRAAVAALAACDEE